jgi:hypothetical protein
MQLLKIETTEHDYVNMAHIRPQFLEWSRIVRLLAPCNFNTPKGPIALILKMVQSEEMSRVSLGCH